MEKQKVVVIGLGYVGLPLLAAITRSEKYNAIGFDISQKRVDDINNKICPIEDVRCAKDMEEFDVKASNDEKILENVDYYIICVPTPIYNDFTPDYRPVEGAVKMVAKYIKKGSTVIVESTINPGTCEEIVIPAMEKENKLKGGKDFTVGHCPERINPGDSKWNVYNINRNIGAVPAKEAPRLAEFYSSFLNCEVNPVSSLKVAEATKIIENTFRDINIAFVNELAKSFDAMGINLHETIGAASNKPFAFMAHWPGCGVGGHCIAVDPYYLIKRAELSGFNHRLLKEARAINNSMPHYTVEKLAIALNEIKKPVNGTKVALLGLSYKANVGDLRESPALEILKELKKRKAKINIYDPFTPDMNTYKTLEETLKNSEVILLATHHNKFRSHLNSTNLKNYPIKLIIDGRNILNKDDIESVGIVYKGIGK